MSRPSLFSHRSTACPDCKRLTAQGRSALHVAPRIPFGTAIVTVYGWPSRFTDFPYSVRVA